MTTEWEFSFEAPEPPVSTNVRRHWAKSAASTRLWREAAASAAILEFGRQTLPPCWVQVTLPFTRAGRRDPHNYISTCVKPVVDGLGPELVRRTKAGAISYSPGAGLWPDDTPEWVTVLEPVCVKNPDGLVVVTLTDRSILPRLLAG